MVKITTATKALQNDQIKSHEVHYILRTKIKIIYSCTKNRITQSINKKKQAEFKAAIRTFQNVISKDFRDS